jgi:DNA-binding PadR family transcriptional regulator
MAHRVLSYRDSYRYIALQSSKGLNMHEHHQGRACPGNVQALHGGFGRHGFKHPGFGGHPGFGAMRARRGDVRAAILRLLAEEPMHGYQIIQELSTRSEGAWSASAGSVYPTLQMLADEGLITSEETGGKKVFSLTDAGKAASAETAEHPAPWEEVAGSDSGFGEYRETLAKLMPAVMQIGRSGSKEQKAAAIEVLTDARKKLYSILSED